MILYNIKRGFTLIEILVVVLIIGILGAIMLPQYQRAVLKSRFAALMPIAKALAEANEVFYLEHGEYSENPADLLVAGRNTAQDGAYPDGTSVLMYSDEADLSFVRTENASIPNARYVVYQKHSTNFPDTTWCEASDEQAEAMCVALGGVLPEGLEGNSGADGNWTAYLLGGQARPGDTFASGGDNGGEEPGTGDEPGTNTEPQEPVTPPAPTCTGEQPATINAPNGATGTATCVNGQWKYTWTGGNVYQSCSGSSAYACAGSTFGGRSYCDGEVANGCAGSTFSGEDSQCIGQAANGCAGSTFSGKRSYCDAWVANGCAGTTFQAGASCSPSSSGGCDGAKYGADPTGKRTGIGSCYDGNGYCPTGVPLRSDNWNSTNGSWDISGWKGDCCNPAYMVSGECPSGIAVCQ